MVQNQNIPRKIILLSHPNLPDSIEESHLLADVLQRELRTPRVVEAVPLMLEALLSDDLETRDTAARALGRMADAIPAGGIPPAQARSVVERLHGILAEPNAGLRAKAVRSLGKMAKAGHMDAAQKETLAGACRRLLGEDGSFEWDRAFVVRKEADQALRSAVG